MLKQRKIIQEIEDKLNNTQNIIIITGARQVGKTSIMRYLEDKYQAQYNRNTLYLDLEDELLLASLNVLANSQYPAYFKNKGLEIDKPGLIFIDEIQYLNNPTKILKYLHDQYKNLRLIVSGSSTLEIKQKIKESLAGRKSVFKVNTLDWREFLAFKNFKGQKNLQSLTLEQILTDQVSPDEIVGLSQELEPWWQEFLMYGGYPKVVLTDKIKDKQDELSEIYNSYVKKDIKDLAQVKEIGKFNKLVQLLAWQTGNLTVAGELANSADLNILTCNKYLDILQNTFVIEMVKPFYQNKRIEIVKSPKIYFEDTGLRNTIIKDYQSADQRPDSGKILENYVFNQLAKNQTVATIKYWRKSNSGLEVDFVLENYLGLQLLPLEVKFKTFNQAEINKSIYSFLETYPTEKFVVINKNLLATSKVNQTKIYFIPFWLLNWSKNFPDKPRSNKFFRRFIYATLNQPYLGLNKVYKIYLIFKELAISSTNFWIAPQRRYNPIIF